MLRLIRFNRQYFILTVILFIVEVLIAMYLNDRIIRPYIGDVLVVMLIYCFVRSFVNTPVLPTAIGTLLFAYLIEVLQYIHIVQIIGLQDYSLARTVMGTSFEWIDMLAYTVGIAIVLLIERKKIRRV